ncbi:MAG: FAD-binding protein [Candidatus Thermoplasmatota archaeon]|jgi:succinate dehydrogenase / fumarate reductase flavoprotein subunit|nr:FAD-binding protein [Candidatus Thermoplasmatota archaeon]
MPEDYETVESDVLVIGAGGAGMRASIAVNDAGLNVVMVTKSLLGKAHTVMAEGGIAASLGNVDPKDNWTVHYGDIIEEGVYISSWKMAEILAKEAPERVLELESYGALFDRTPDGRIMQRAFGAHTYRRLAHLGDRTGLEIIKTLEHQVIHRDIKFFDEIYITNLIKDGEKIAGAFGIKMNTGQMYLFKAKSFVIATGGSGRVYKVTSNSWESTGDGIGMAFRAGVKLRDMEMIQFHPTGMVYPPGAKGILVTEGVRGEGGILLNSKGERFMLRYSPQKKELDARDVVARANYREIMEGRGTEHGGVYLDITQKGPDFIKHKLPAMYQQFMEFAGVDITKEKMEVAPTVHYMMGGIEVEPETERTNVVNLFSAGEVASGLHGANRLGGNSLSDILVFGKIAGESAAGYAKDASPSKITKKRIDQEIKYIKSFFREDGKNPYDLIDKLTTCMSENVGIVRDAEHLQKAVEIIEELKKESTEVGTVGMMKYNHGLLGCLELANMLISCEAITKCAIMREESRGAHTRSDFPKRNKDWKKNIITSMGDDGKMMFEIKKVEEMPDEYRNYVKPEVYE